MAIPSPLRWLLAGIAAAGTAWAAGLPLGFTHHGNFQRMVHSGDTAGQVALAALPQQPGSWGVGALAGLQGEIVQLDGRLLVSLGSDVQGRTQPPEAGAQAVLFAGGPVQAWHAVTLPQAMDQPAFEAFVQAQAAALGIAAGQPFVFRVEGQFPHLLWHVVTGAAPAGGGHDQARGPQGHGGHGGHGVSGGHGGHTNDRSDMRLFRQPGASGQLVGVYSGAALEGVVSHPGERFHVHYADAGATVSGHVDRYSVAAGAVLRLPLR